MRVLMALTVLLVPLTTWAENPAPSWYKEVRSSRTLPDGTTIAVHQVTETKPGAKTYESKSTRRPNGTSITEVKGRNGAGEWVESRGTSWTANGQHFDSVRRTKAGVTTWERTSYSKDHNRVTGSAIPAGPDQPQRIQLPAMDGSVYDPAFRRKVAEQLRKIAAKRGRPIEVLLMNDPKLRVSARPDASLDEVDAAMAELLR
jgi:hypothetical protein